MNKIKTIPIIFTLIFSLIISNIAFSEQSHTYYRSFKMTHTPPVPTTEYDMYEFLVGLFIVLLAICILFATYMSYEKSKLRKEVTEGNIALEKKILDSPSNADPNIARIMSVLLTNLKESTEFFQITKYQVKISFGAAILFAIFGLIIF